MNLENEQTILGAIFLDPSVLDVVLEHMSPDDFFHQPNTVILRCMISMREKEIEINLVTVSNELEKLGKLNFIGGPSYLATLFDATPTASEHFVTYYCKEIRDASIKRKMAELFTDIQKDSQQKSAAEMMAHAESGLLGLVLHGAKDAIARVGDLLGEIQRGIEDRYKTRKEGKISGLPTGIKKLDYFLNGLQETDLIIIAGRPGSGKSAMMGLIFETVSVKHQIPAIVFSMEMSRKQLIGRLLYSMARVDQTRARMGNFELKEFQAMSDAGKEIDAAPLYIDDTAALHISEIKSRARRAVQKYGIQLILIDYIQLGKGKSNENRTQEVADISHGLKAMAKELKVPVVALSQLNRALEGRTNKRPILSDLRECGDIEQDADVIIFIYRETMYCLECQSDDKICTKGHENKAEIIIAKQRNGPVGTINAHWVPHLTRFENVG